jgi:hypothetical protein
MLCYLGSLLKASSLNPVHNLPLTVIHEVAPSLSDPCTTALPMALSNGPKQQQGPQIEAVLQHVNSTAAGLGQRAGAVGLPEDPSSHFAVFIKH